MDKFDKLQEKINKLEKEKKSFEHIKNLKGKNFVYVKKKISEKDLFIINNIEELSIDTISERTGLALSTVYSRLQRFQEFIIIEHSKGSKNE